MGAHVVAARLVEEHFVGEAIDRVVGVLFHFYLAASGGLIAQPYQLCCLILSLHDGVNSYT